MRRKFGKYTKLLFKLFLLIQLYCYHNLEVGAIPSMQEKLETCDERHHHNNRTYFGGKSEQNLQRNKRPVRLLPRTYPSKKEKNGTEYKNAVVYYGPAASCAEISKLGYTLNGYYLVKGKNQTINSKVEVLGCRFKHPDGSREVKEERIGFIDIEITKSTKFRKRRSQEPSIKTSPESIKGDINGRHKRPARLIPARIILGKHKNNTDNKDATEKRFYGPASSCEELGKLGYTLNGLYLVDCKDKSNKGKIEVIECRFKQPRDSKEAKEERLGFLNTEVKKTKSVQRRYSKAVNEKSSAVRGSNQRIILQRPARLLPLQLLYENEKNETGRFYGPPNNCSELQKLGYTLNGYYLVTGTVSSHKIEISLCKFHQPFDANENDITTIYSNIDLFKEERFALLHKKVLRHLPLHHARNESYPLRNAGSDKCLGIESILTSKFIIPTHCNSSSVRRWKLANGGMQLCDESAQCITAAFSKEPFKPPLFLIPMLGADDLKTGQIGNFSLGKTEITFFLDNQAYCVGVMKITESFRLRYLPQKITLELCKDNDQYQIWSFISFE